MINKRYRNRHDLPREVLTVELLGRKRERRNTAHVSLAHEVASRLEKEYGAPRLGNYKNPFKEIIYILLSARTAERLYQPVTKELFKAFKSAKALGEADIEAVYEIVKVAGFGRKRAVQIHAIANRLNSDFPTCARKHLNNLTAQQLFNYLTSLPGVGPKSALCTMMFSFDFDVFPVDINVQRVATRLGMLPPFIKHYRAQQILPAVVPPGCSRALHVGLMEHGRKICLPQRPKCFACCISVLCKTANLNNQNRAQ